MLKILFSPSEGKNSGGDAVKNEILGSFSPRDEILQTYNSIINNADEATITQLFGIKKFNECKPYIQDIFHSPLMHAIERYRGVAYDYLNYTSLPINAQEYLKKNTIIFSNLYGPILAGDAIANYKVKQGNSIGTIMPEKYYKQRFSYQLDLYLGNDEILDLRAGYYEKFYKIERPFTTLKFLQNGKAVSHWAKAYRGIVLHELAKHNITSIEEFQALSIHSLQLREIKTTKHKTEMIYDIIHNEA